MLNANLTGSYQIAVVLIPKQEFIDWVNILTEKGLFSKESLESSVYLFPELKTVGEIEEAIKAGLWVTLFDNELLDWTDEAILLPKTKSYQMFCEWLEVKMCTNVFQVA